MKIIHLFPELKRETEVIAYFGKARLEKTFDGKYELVGGAAADRAEAQEWISIFFHETVPTIVHGAPAAQ